MSIPEKILQAGCDAYAATFLNGNGSLGDGIEAAYLAIHEHDDWVRAGPPAWTGEGLPPVGMVCECRLPGEITNDYSWVEARVIWHNGPTECAVIRSTSKLAWCDEFRPIRTPEQIAEEEREKAITQILNLMLGHDQASIHEDTVQALCAKRIYDAGYRKPPAP